MKLTKSLSPFAAALVLSLAALAAPAAASGSPPRSRPLTMDLADAATKAAIQAVIQRGNQEQAQALAQGNPAIMQDTSTSNYYAQMVQTNQDLKSSGVKSIELLNLSWGQIRLLGQNRARAVTDETWRTTYADGGADESTDVNVYTLIQQSGGWKIQFDVHPGSEVDIPSPGQPTGQPVPSGGQQGSINWSGYTATGGSFTGVSGTWIVPQPSALGLGADAAWVGIGGLSTSDLIQAGTDETIAGGQASYDAWIETLPQASHTVPLSIHAGDSVSISIAQQSQGQWQVSMRDNTTGQSYQQAIAYNSSGSSAEWVEEAPTGRRGVLPLDNFGTVSFSGAKAIKNGQSVSIAQAGGQPITMINAFGQAVATPSALGSDGSSFSVKRMNVSTTAQPGGVVTIPLGPVGPGVPLGYGYGPWPFGAEM